MKPRNNIQYSPNHGDLPARRSLYDYRGSVVNGRLCPKESCCRVPTSRFSLRLLVAVLTLAVTVIGLPTAANAQTQQLKLPFRAGGVQINFDETYFGTQPHPTNGAIAFDISVTPHDPNVEILAMGNGQVRHLCTHKSGAAILVFQADGYAGDFVFVHLEASSLPSWMSTDWSRVARGDVIGRMFPDRVDGQQGDECLQFSTGPHLHLDLPALGIVIDGISYTEDFPNDFEQLTSTNGLAGPDSAICDGLDATIIGTPGNDLLIGTPGVDVIAALQGNDEVYGMGGDDVICGGIGDDILVGGQGFDVIFGAQGRDSIYGADGIDAEGRVDTAGGRYFGGKDNDRIYGTSRWDRMQGGPGNDLLIGYAGRDWMRGGAGQDHLNGGSAIDNMHGGNQNDELIVGQGDTVRGGAGANDRCDLSGGEPEVLISCEDRF